jgi:protoporphyrinogen oxidase
VRVGTHTRSAAGRSFPRTDIRYPILSDQIRHHDAPTATAEHEAPVAVIGAGPAGLTAAYLLAKRGDPAVVLESEDQVGGLAKTVERDGYRFDLGGHRFFTKSAEVQVLWHEIMGDEMLERPRLSRIYWNGKFLDYPLRIPDVVRKLGPVELTRASGSYLRAQARRGGPEDTFEEWVCRRFGRRLFELFFRSYTEKVWGVPTSEIRAEWAAQRIKNLSPLTAVRAALMGNGGGRVTSLIDRFHYPRHGPGQMWETMAARIRAAGAEVALAAPVEEIAIEDDRVVEVRAPGRLITPRAVISSLPLRTLVGSVRPSAPEEVREAARGLRYRDFLTVALVLEGDDLFPDNWIYVHDARVRVGRIQNYRAWSPWMVPDNGTTCVGMEYFCFAGDELWRMSDDDLVALGAEELVRIGLAPAGRVRGGYAVRVPKAYPMYDADYTARVAVIRRWLEGLENLQQIGRNGLHRYNNSDHSMLTAMRAVENLDGAEHDLWAVNAESVYHEEARPEEQPYRRAPETPAMAEPLAGAGQEQATRV